MFFDKFKLVIKSKFFITNFSMLFFTTLIVFALFALYQHYSSKEIISNQLIGSETNSLREIVESVDERITTAKRQADLLAANSLATVVLNSSAKEPDLLYNQKSRLGEYLTALVSSNSFVNSIYLYSDVNKTVFVLRDAIPITQFEDSGWLAHLETKDTMVYARAMNNIYPYVITILTPFKISGRNALVISNLTFDTVPAISEIKTGTEKKLFVISDDGIIFSNRQQSAVENISDFPQLVSYDIYSGKSIIRSSGNTSQLFSTVKSDTTNWYYVQISPIPEYDEQISASIRTFVLLISMLILLAFCISFYFSFRNYNPIHRIYGLLSADRYPTKDLSDMNSKELQYIANNIVHNITLNRELSDKLLSQLSVLKSTELLALQSQFNPHFLFNTLNMIHILEVEQLGYEHPLPQITVTLSKLLRYSMDSASMVTVKKDFYYTKQYVEILEKRYPDTIDVSIEIDPAIVDCEIPKLLVQPLVENAVIHGYSSVGFEKFHIRICCISVENNTQIQITVKDNGRGLKDNVIKQIRKIEKSENLLDCDKNTGIYYVILKLKSLYNTNYKFEISSVLGKGSTIILTLPSGLSRKE